ncbi:efflux transporter outer membrane subunit [Herbaspirillum seropedicae]|uniref:efflux transporter outer membrane subunit n=1 Tax=Herbaspirillum seropedicae TaxID=964 RepID=UPI0008482A88|nr:efflux transporter outer membrane subunit [Herbaspirillum seropedicae]AON53868.1 NodT family protein [Herbaspirillum seropedicae]MDR6396851.1 NodT family efflux transporter outer membrane factor (OMF) lipoprotein [Herbaspirillum seropedicae]
MTQQDLFKLKPLLAMLVASLALAACSVGPDYVRPQMDTGPAIFKEGQNWKPAQPRDLVADGKWWEMFGDPQLNALVAQVDISNQNLALAEANFRSAVALVQSSRSAYSPTLSASAGASRGSSGSAGASSSNAASGSSAGSVRNSYTFSLTAAWEADIWGKVRRDVESSQASAQASAADLAAARLSAQAQVAQNYLQLRVLDAQQQLLEETVQAYERSLQVAQNQYAAGMVAKSDVIQAQTQLKSAQASALDNGVTRAQVEHAIALLVGKTPAQFALPRAPLAAVAPPVPQGVPSMLLERRPDVAAAERRVASANAKIGVAKAAYFPSLTLSASGGYQSSTFADWFTLPGRVWSLGPQLAQTIFDGGARAAATDQAIATYDGTVATYKQTVLTAFQEVEDNLAALRILEQEAAVQGEALQAARQAVTLVNNQYKAGTVSYVNVITAQATALSAELSSLNILNRRMAASVLLAKALGGGWDEHSLDDLGSLQQQSAEKAKALKENAALR